MSQSSIPTVDTPSFVLLAATSFINGMVVMAMELAGSRVLAPYLGSSLYVWTSLIGVILASLSVGNYAGGVLADRDFSRGRLSSRRLALFFLFGSFTLGLLVFSEAPAAHFAATTVEDLRLATVLASIILFCCPSVVLGMVSPYVVRLALCSTASPGRVVGTLSSLSTCGCIVGTFVTGFVLLETLGTVRLLLVLSIMLASLALVLGGRRWIGGGTTLLLILGALLVDAQKLDAAAGGAAIATKDTRYSRVRVLEWKEGERTMRALSTDPFTVQSIMDVDRPNAGIESYYSFFDLFKVTSPSARTVLALGGGAYSIPKKLIAEHPELTVDVIEIDPGLTTLAERYFSLQSNPRLHIFHQDARLFLQRTTQRYDIIFQDTFLSGFAIPFHLATIEFYAVLAQRLAPDGVLFINLMSAVEGDHAKFLEALVSSIRPVLPAMRIFKADPNHSNSKLQNIGLIAARDESAFSRLSDMPRGKDALSTTEFSREPLTDDCAPVDRYALEGYRDVNRK